MCIKHNTFSCRDIEVQLADSEYLAQCLTCLLDPDLEGDTWEEGLQRPLRIMQSEMHSAGGFGEKPQRTGRGNDGTDQREAAGSGARGLAAGSRWLYLPTVEASKAGAGLL